jgi:FkbM family methyltransferase
MLWRALGSETPGCYIDFGASEPVIDSVSRLFYERGWRGIHVEPSKILAAKIRTERPDELVLEAAVDNVSNKVVMFNECEDPDDFGCGTVDPDVIKIVNNTGRRSIAYEVATITMDDVFDRCDAQDIHWLKIDIEGFEKKALEGWHSSKRPWIVLVEAIEPFIHKLNHEAWEYLLLNMDYKPVWFDGVNRFYLHKNHMDLEHFFTYAPNVLDGFILSASSVFCKYLEIERRNAELAASNAELSASQLRQEKAELLEEAAALKNAEQAASNEASQLRQEKVILLKEAAALKKEVFDFEYEATHFKHEASAFKNSMNFLYNETCRQNDTLKQMQDALNQQGEALNQMQDALNRKDEALNQIRELLALTYNSRSWRITRPLRFLTTKARGAGFSRDMLTLSGMFGGCKRVVRRLADRPLQETPVDQAQPAAPARQAQSLLMREILLLSSPSVQGMPVDQAQPATPARQAQSLLMHEMLLLSSSPVQERPADQAQPATLARQAAQSLLMHEIALWPKEERII